MMDIEHLKKRYSKWVEKSTLAVSYTESFFLITICIYFEFNNPHPLFKSTLIVFCGWFIWILTEYLVHRFLFHFKSENKYLLLIKYILHGVHHHRPSKSLFAPIVLRVITQVFVFLFLKLIFGEYIYLFYLGIVIGVVHYITIHYSLHHSRWSKFFPRLTKFHYIHHYISPNSCFGTTSLFWDKVFGTLPSVKNEEIKYNNKDHFI